MTATGVTGESRPAGPPRPQAAHGHLHLAGSAWPWRPATLLALTIAAAIGADIFPAAAAHRNRP